MKKCKHTLEKIIIFKSVGSGGLDYTSNIIQSVYWCSQCGAVCTKIEVNNKVFCKWKYIKKIKR